MGFFSKLFGKAGSDGTGGREPGMGVDELARRLKTDATALRNFPVAYTEMRIANRAGGVRVLHVPSAELKQLQKTILRRLLGRLAAHPAAMGFERGMSIATNAAPHVGASLLVKMDLLDFFTRTTARRIRQYFVGIGWGGEAADLMVKLTTHNGGLPQGAPTSPRLSNLVNYVLDARLSALKWNYTRYADDMTFSLRGGAPAPISYHPPETQRTAKAPESFVSGSKWERRLVATLIQCTKNIAQDYGYSLHQKKKLQIRRRHDRMLVTGLVVNDRLNLPRQTRRKLRAVRHHLQIGRPATLTPAQLRGWESLRQC